jgi:hypothetical protein
MASTTSERRYHLREGIDGFAPVLRDHTMNVWARIGPAWFGNSLLAYATCPNFKWGRHWQIDFEIGSNQESAINKQATGTLSVQVKLVKTTQLD